MTMLSQHLPLIGAGYMVVYKGMLPYRACLTDFNGGEEWLNNAFLEVSKCRISWGQSRGGANLR